jgi:hypothetical protein
MWHNKYVGIPYKDNGRDLDGVDCWGLARYVYNKEFNISLPSFSFNYDSGDRERIQELIAQYREGWEEITQEYKTGDLVLFRMMGYESHVGIVTEYPYFLHAREKADSSVERLDNTQWKNRVIGIFRYSSAAKNNLVAIPHPLKTERITDYIPEGATLHQVHEVLCKQHNISDSTNIKKAIIIVNGKPIPETEWDYIVKENDSIEYRAVAGQEVLRVVAVVALVYFTMGAGGQFAFSLAGFTGATGGTLAIMQMGVMAAGMALINAIMPIRPPEQGSMSDPGQSKSQNLINGSSNNATPYGSVPVVLGRVRMTPPLGAANYVEPMATEAYVRMLLTWGYGPVSIEDLRIGTNTLDDYELDYKTYYGYGTESAAELADFNAIYGNDVQQVVKNIKLVGSEGSSPWQEVTFTQPSTQLGYSIHFPQGLRKINNSNGNSEAAPFIAEIQYDLVGNNNWTSNLYSFPTKSFTLANSTVTNYTRTGGGGRNGEAIVTVSSVVKYYQWHTIYMKQGSGVFSISGTPSEAQAVEPSDSLRKQIAGNLNGYWSTTSLALDTSKLQKMTRIPALDPGDIALFDVCVYDGAIISTLKRTDIGTHDTTISVSGLTVTTSAGTVSVATGILVAGESNYIKLGANAAQGYLAQKDAFTYIPESPINVPPDVYKMRIRRINSGATDLAGYQVLHDAYFYTATAYSNNVPVTDPPVGKFARTALRIKATDQISGSVEAINALVTSICPDWDSVTSTWITRTTNNPASLMRYILQHPANARRILDSEVSTKIDLAQLQYWHAYCISKGFTYNNVLSNPRSILDVLRDVCAAGRASPALVDGKWTVVIDEAKTTVVQHFSTHNSWGFQGTKPLVKIPDAFKVVFINEASNYVQDEMYVYNKGQNSTTAQLFEELQLPGVTNGQAAFKHARWHLAQLLLRPETYTLNADLEYLVCNRGDLVRVQHDVPQWGIGTARIKTYVNSTTLVLDNDIPLTAGSTYTIRIRTATGASVTRTLGTIATSGFTNQVTVTAALTVTQGAADNLVMIGLSNTESQECLVLSVEPSTNGTARLTLVDYTAAMYNIDSSPDYPIPSFVSNITKYRDTFITVVQQSPTITAVVSDSTAVGVVSLSVDTNRIKVSFTETPGQPALDTKIVEVELQWKLSADTNTSWPNTTTTPVGNDSIYATGVTPGESYDVRVRYNTWDGAMGPWTYAYGHTVSGKTVNYNTANSVSVKRSKRFLVITPLVTTWPKDFDHFEIRVYKDKTNGTNDFWSTVDTTNIKTYTSNGTISVDLKDFAVPRLRELISTTGTIGNVQLTGIGPTTYSATITGMTSTTGLEVGNSISATNGTGSISDGIPTSITVASLVNGTSINYNTIGPLAPVAGTVTDITTPNVTYRIACRLVDTNGNYSTSSVLTSITLSDLAP